MFDLSEGGHARGQSLVSGRVPGMPARIRKDGFFGYLQGGYDGSDDHPSLLDAFFQVLPPGA